MTGISLIFLDGPHPINNEQLDIIVVDAEGMFYFVQLYLTNASSVLEMIDGLDPYDVYKRKVKKGAYHSDMLYVLIIFFLFTPKLSTNL